MSVGNLTEPPPSVDNDTKKKISEAVEKDPTGEGVGGPGEDDVKKSNAACK